LPGFPLQPPKKPSAERKEKKGKERKGKERKGKERKHYAIWRQFHKKPSIIPRPQLKAVE